MTTPRPTIEQEYATARPRSTKALYERARQIMPSGAAHDGRVFAPLSCYVERAGGARTWDVDGDADIVTDADIHQIIDAFDQCRDVRSGRPPRAGRSSGGAPWPCFGQLVGGLGRARPADILVRPRRRPGPRAAA